MKKLCIFAVVIALLLSLTGLAIASVGYKKDGENEGNAVSVDFKNGLTTFDGSTVSFYANGYKDGVTTNVSTESNLTSAALAYGIIQKVSIDSTDDVKVTLANGTPGQMVTIMLMDNVSGGDWVITDDGVSATAQAALLSTGWDDLTFDTDLDSITLLYVDDTIGWIIVGNNGVTVT